MNNIKQYTTGVRLKVSKLSVLIPTLKGCQNSIPENNIVPWYPNGAYWMINGAIGTTLFPSVFRDHY